MRKYHDIESGEIITMSELEKEYQMLVKNGTIEKEEQNFYQYIENCLTRNNGTLEIIYA